MLPIKLHSPRRTFLRALGGTMAVPVLDRMIPGALAQTAVHDWHVTATVAESCSCDVSCPCNFGSSPTRMPCTGNRLIALKSAHLGKVDLSGVAFLITFAMRGWSKIVFE